MSKFFTVEISNPAFESNQLRFLTVKSNALRKRGDITLFLPHNVPLSAIKGMVILLHGVYGSHWSWALQGGVHTTAQQLIDQQRMEPMLLIMPSDGLFGDGSAYLPHQSEDYEKWIVEEVIAVVQEQLTDLPQNLPIFITGLSMGGYGALRLGAKYPHVFTSFSGLSSITDFPQLLQFLDEADKISIQTHIVMPESVLEWMIANKEQLPSFRFDCGSDDLLIEFNRALHQQLLENNITHQYHEYPGSHQWEYWQTHIAETLLFFNDFIK